MAWHDSITKAQLVAGFELLALGSGCVWLDVMESAMVHGDDERPGDPKLFVNCNDFFSPAADEELIPWAETEDCLASYKQEGSLMPWVSGRRGVECVHWKSRGSR